MTGRVFQGFLCVGKVGIDALLDFLSLTFL